MSGQGGERQDNTPADMPDRRRVVAGGAAGTLAYLMGLGQARAQIASTPFLGSIMLVGFDFAPVGWAFCNGSLQSIAQNSALFSLIGTTFGGDGVTTFALPDLRGRAPVGYNTTLDVGASYGTETVTLNSNEIPAHTHSLPVGTNAPTSRVRTGASGGVITKTNIPAATMFGGATDLVSLGAGNILPAGGNQAHENRQPYLVMNYIIATDGIFPSRN